MTTNKLSGILGICRRAGHLFVGFDAVSGLVADGRAKQILLACDVSEKTAKELRFLAEKRQTPLAVIPTDKEALGALLGLQKPVGVIATDDGGFAAAMQKYI